MDTGYPTSGELSDDVCDAEHPADISERGWLHVLRRLGRSLARDGMWLRSAGVAYCALFAAIPGAAVPVSLVGLLADPRSVHHPVEMLGGLLPPDASAFLADQMQAVALASRAQLGAGLGGAVLAALWGAWSGASGLIGALNTAYGEDETRSFLRRSRDALFVAIATCLFMTVAFCLVALLPLISGRVAPNTSAAAIVSLVRWPALAVMTSLALALLYRLAPSRRGAKWRWVSPGALVATALWLACSTAFSYYAANVPSYNRTLGALGMVMLLLTWSYLTAFAVLLGAELNAELERQTARDTTRGPSRRIGERGAVVADTKLQGGPMSRN